MFSDGTARPQSPVPAGDSWALVNQALADLMSEPAVSSERTSQVLLGEAVEVLSRHDEWLEVRLERDGYEGWVRGAAVLEARQQRVRDYQVTCETIVTAEIAQAFLDPGRRKHAGKLPFGVCLPGVERTDGAIALELPDGRRWWVAASDVIATSERPRPDPAGIALALGWLGRSVGVPYLWGGSSPFGYDCSGLSQAFWAALGVRIPRDAHQQFQTGQHVAGPPRPGDLLFFRLSAKPGEGPRHEDVRHVAIALGGDDILHANGRTRSVAIDALRQGGDAYADWLLSKLAGVRRYA